MIRQALISALCAISLTACAPPRVAYLSDDIPRDASLHAVFIAKSGTSPSGALFSTGRQNGMQFGRAVVAIPAVHQVGQVLWPRIYPPTPDRHFVLSDVGTYPNADSFDRALPSTPASERVVYVHGFNVTPSEAVYTAAQVHKDFALTDPPIVFSWPSAGRPRGYLHDRDSVLFARSDLAALLTKLTDDSTDRVSLLAHSMGAALVMEALRELVLKGETRVLERISSVILVAPDLDPEVFRRQARDIGKLPQPFVVFVATNDEALRFASLFSFERRLGAIQDASDIGELEVTLIDLTSLSDGQRFNHEIALTSPAAIRLLKGVREGDPTALQALEQYLVRPAPPIILAE